MKHKKLLLVFGTRPEAIKMIPIINMLKQTKCFDYKVCVTGQHKEMLNQVLSLFDVVPDYNLDIMKKDQDLFDVTTAILSNIKDILASYCPDMVLVHGDTSTAFASALAAFYLQIPIGHVEAGLRTYDIYSPWPEEANRQLIDRLTSIYFAPTDQNRQFLLNEGISDGKIIVTGNTVIDALKFIDKKNDDCLTVLHSLIAEQGYTIHADRRFILVTGHRRENFGQGFENICDALYTIAVNNRDIDIVYPVHLNPKVKDVVFARLSKLENIYLLSPLEYQPFVYMMKNAYIIVTDSGGIQEEAPFFGKPVLVMRDVTEREEAVAAGTVKLVGTDKSKIIGNVQLLLDNQDSYQAFSKKINPYGVGNASEKIVEALKNIFNG